MTNTILKVSETPFDKATETFRYGDLYDRCCKYEYEIEQLKEQRASSEVVSELTRYEEIIKKLNNTIDVLIGKIKE